MENIKLKDATIIGKEPQADLRAFLARLSDAVQCAALATQDVGLAPALPPLVVPGVGRCDTVFPTEHFAFKGRAGQSMKKAESAEPFADITMHFPHPASERISFGIDSIIVIRINPLFWSQDNVDVLTWLKAELREQGFDRAQTDNEIRLNVETFIENIDALRHYLLNFPELDTSAYEEMEDTLEYAVNIIGRIPGSKLMPFCLPGVVDSEPSAVSSLN